MTNVTITIGITDCGKWSNYTAWFEQVKGVKALKLTWKENNFQDINKCNGIVLSGGEDVHPRFYKKPELYSLLDPKEIKTERDEFELKLIERSLKKKKPLLGICRGLQIANVFFGGTLIPDIPSQGKPSHSKVKGYDQRHSVNIAGDSLLQKIIRKYRGEVNSAHHQCADKVAGELKVNAFSDDGIIEGLEWKNPSEKSFLLLVQWHPERMKDTDSPFAKNIRDGFLNRIKE